MSTWVSKEPGVAARHSIEVSETAQDVVSRTHARFEYTVSWPHMWHPGDSVAVTLAGSVAEYPGVVLSVSWETRKVLIELT